MPPDPPSAPELEDPAPGFRARDLLGSHLWIPLALIVAYGCYVRISGFNARWINPDEGIYYSMATWDSWQQFYQEFALNAHPPLYYVLLKLLSGISPEVWLLRSIALVFGCCWIPAAFLFARECVGRGSGATLTGLIAAFLIAISYTAIEMSQLIRPYTMQITCMTMALYFLVRYLRVGGRSALVAYAVLMIGAMLMHYSTMLVFGGVGIALVGLAGCRQFTGAQVRTLAIWNLPVLAVAVTEYLWHIRPKLEESRLVSESLETWLKPFMIDGVSDVGPRLLGMLSSGFLFRFEGPALIALTVGIALAFVGKNMRLGWISLSVFAVAVAAAAAHKYPLGCSRHSLYLAGIAVVPIAFVIASGLTHGLRTAGLTVAAVAALLAFRAPVSNALGSPQLQRVPENPLLRSDYVRAKAEFVKDEPGFTLMSTQTYFQLMPEYHRERQVAEHSRDGVVRRFRWGQRNVIVFDAWEFDVDPKNVNRPFHLYQVIQSVDRVMPEIRFGEQTDVVLLIGSWSRLGARLGMIGDAVRRSTTVPGFTALELDVARYRAAVANAGKRGR